MASTDFSKIGKMFACWKSKEKKTCGKKDMHNTGKLEITEETRCSLTKKGKGS